QHMTPPTPPTPPPPPRTPPDKRPDRHYNFERMNMVFGVSSLVLLAVTLWMVFADYAQPWKRYQAEFRALERQKLAKDAEDERKKINEQQVTQLQKDVAAAKADLEQHNTGAKELEKKIARLKADDYTANAEWKKAKGYLDASRFEYDTALQAKAGDAQDKARKVARYKAELAAAQKKKENLEAELDATQAQLAEKRKT